MTDLITLSSSVLEDSARVIGFRGTEAMSRPYEIEIYFTLPASDSEAFDMADAIGAKGVLTLDRGDPDVPPFRFAGVFDRVELLQEVGSRTLFRAFLVPKLRQLALSRHSRVFAKRSFPEVLAAVLVDNGLSPEDFELRLGTYEVEEHVCQYRESDLDFLSRWMEREGIYYFFEHGEHGEKIVFADAKSYESDPVGAPVPYHPQGGDDRSAGACFRSFTCRHTNLPAAVKLKDYDYTHPNLSVTGAAAVSQNGAGEISLYGERFFTPSAGERLAKLRAEELLARQAVFRAGGTRTHLRPGYTFRLEDHPRGAFNSRYLAVEVEHHGNQGGEGSAFGREWSPLHDEVYFAEVHAIPAATQFRAESRAPWPRIYGYENGVVDGAADTEYAQIDEHGRYKVKLFFDESSLKGGGASTFVRMMQPHGGGVEGFHFPLRKGTEVLLSFLGGDPDRPVISGVAPNALTPSPVTSGNHTTNVVQTGAGNRIEMEDQAGSERITISSPNKNTYIKLGAEDDGWNLILHTDGHMFINPVGDTYVRAGGNWHEEINYEVVRDYYEREETTVHGPKKTTVKGPVTEYYQKAQTTQVLTGNRQVSVAEGASSETVAQGFTVTAGGGVTFLVNVPYFDGWYFTPREAGFHVCVDNERVFIEAKQSTIDLEAMTGISLSTTSGWARLHAGQGIELTSNGPLTIDCHQDAVQWTLGDSVSATIGNSQEYTYGNTFELQIGFASSMFAGPKLDMAMAASLSLNLGLTASWSLAEFAVKSMDLASADTKIETGLIKAVTKVLHLLG